MKFEAEIHLSEEQHQREREGGEETDRQADRQTDRQRDRLNVNQPIWTTLHKVFTYSMLV